MSKKYLSLEEAAQQLGITTEVLNKAREKGDIRGFADRASWKFRDEDVVNYGRSISADSAPEVPIIDADSSIFGDDDLDMSDSASDVRLILDDELIVGDDNKTDEVKSKSDSDSDLQLGFSNQPSGSQGSDSDVRLVEPDASTHASAISSGIQEISESDVASDVHDSAGSHASAVSSGVQEVSESDLSSDVSSGSDVTDNVLDEEELERTEGLTLTAGSSILGGEESGISLEAADSGISLEAADSGISLESLDSGIDLTDDDSVDDFTADEEDSGITLDGDDAGATVTLDSMGPESDLMLDDTQFEMESAGGSSEYEITGLGDDDQDDTSVLLLDDEDETDAASPTMVGAGVDDFDDEETFDLGDDDAGAFNEFEDDDLMVEETVIGEDDEFDDMEVFDAVDEDFDDGYDMGGSGDFAVAGQGIGRPQLAPEMELGTGAFIGVTISSVLMVVCSLIMIDLVRSMWSYQQPASYSSAILDMIKGMF